MHISTVSSDAHLNQILSLQKRNLPENITNHEKALEGFVTVKHSFDVLKKMNTPYPHVVAIDHDTVIGYALVMLQSVKSDIEILKPMFKKINQLHYKEKLLSQQNYFVMGQVCIAKAYRGQGVFDKMYEHLKETTQSYFDMVITEVSIENPRSLKAHKKLGFQNILKYKSPDGHPWAILLWDFRLK